MNGGECVQSVGRRSVDIQPQRAFVVEHDSHWGMGGSCSGWLNVHFTSWYDYNEGK